MSSASILTIVHKRRKALINLLQGLQRSSVPPSEVVIVYMNEEPYDLPAFEFPVVGYQISGDGHLPLAEARNLAAVSANYNQLIFLDVDCIPGQNLIQSYLSAFEKRDILWAGQVRYLHKGAADDPLVFENLHAWSIPDAIRTSLTAMTYELFWSLNFGCSKQVFDQIGGFDADFRGYGAEDTDFSFNAKKNGVEIDLIDTFAYHQYHDSYSPPLNHLNDIVANALKFRNKWGVWPMRGWLQKFADGNFVEWTATELRVLKQPTATDLAETLKS